MFGRLLKVDIEYWLSVLFWHLQNVSLFSKLILKFNVYQVCCDYIIGPPDQHILLAIHFTFGYGGGLARLILCHACVGHLMEVGLGMRVYCTRMWAHTRDGSGPTQEMVVGPHKRW